jgi:alkylation response protein AidB-like acyl-CoA dehydrogenase
VSTSPPVSLALGDEERMLRDTVRDLLAEHSPVAAVRRLRDAPECAGYDAKLWRRLVELGATELLLPNETGMLAAGVVARELGRNLVASPFLATSTSLRCLAAAGAPSLDALADRVLAGEALTVPAFQEGGHHSDRAPATTATRSGTGYLLRGVKQHVPLGATADSLIVSAALDGATALFVVEGSAVERRAGRLIDTQPRARIELVDAPGVLLCPATHADEVLRSSRMHTTALLAAEMLGAAEAAFALTIAHLQRREQFDVLIGTFQALQHRAARLYVEIELGTSLVLEALRMLDAADPEAPVAVSAAKAFINDVALNVTAEGVQMHGGMGMTDEVDIGLYLKRARVAAAELGDSAYHHRVVAAARGL